MAYTTAKAGGDAAASSPAAASTIGDDLTAIAKHSLGFGVALLFLLVLDHTPAWPIAVGVVVTALLFVFLSSQGPAFLNSLSRLWG